MSDAVLITLVIAAAVIVVLFLFRDQLKAFIFKANREGVEAQLHTYEPQQDKPSQMADAAPNPDVVISGNELMGTGNEIDVGRSSVQIDKNVLSGDEGKIRVRPDKT